MVDYTDAAGNMNGAQAPAPEPETPAAPQAPSQAQARAVDNKLSAGQRVDLRQSEQDPRRVDRPAAPKGNASRPGYDPDIEKAQGYMRMFGITEVDVNGQKKELGVDGVNGPVTSAALTKYKADNGLGNEDDFASVLRHMEERAKKNAPDLQERMRQTAAQGPLANPNNVMGMQLILNLLAPIISALTGGKINLQQLKIDGVNGTQTTNAFNGYQAAPAVTPKPDAKPAAAPAAPSTGSGAATPTTAAPTAAPARPAAPAVAAPAQPAAPATPQVDTAREQALKTELGMNDEEWATLKKAQLEWEDRASKGQEVSKISPLAREQLKLAQAHEPALEAGQKPRSDEVIMKEKGIDPLAALGPRGKIYAEQGPNGGVVFVKPPEPAAPAVATPKAPAAPAQPAVATVVPNKDPNASLAERAAYRQQQVDGYMQTRGLTEQQANFQVTRDRYQELRGAGMSSIEMSRMVSEERHFASQGQEARPGYQRAAAPQAINPLAPQYNDQAGRTVPSLDERMEARAERIKMYVDRGMPLRDASRTVGQERIREMEAQGYDRNTTRTIVNAENKIEETQIKEIEAQQKAAANAARNAARNQQAADKENERDGRTFAAVGADLGGLKGNDKRLAVVLGGAAFKLGGAVLGDSAPSDSGDKERGRFGRDIGNAVGGGIGGKLGEALFRRGGDVVTYPQQAASGQQRFGEAGGFSYDRRLSDSTYPEAARNGLRPEDRAEQLLQAQQQATAPAVAQPERVAYSRQNDLYSPGG